MGHYYSGMLDIMTDETLLSIAFGTHVELLEVDELSALCAEADEGSIARRVDEFHTAFDMQPDCAPEELRRAARTSVGARCTSWRTTILDAAWPTTTKAREMRLMKTP